MWGNSRAVLEKNLPRPPHQQPLLLMSARQSLKPHTCETDQIVDHAVDIISLGPIKYSYAT